LKNISHLRPFGNEVFFADFQLKGATEMPLRRYVFALKNSPAHEKNISHLPQQTLRA
jgi:hypothetical protein